MSDCLTCGSNCGQCGNSSQPKPEIKIVQKGIWRFGFRWCEACYSKCQSKFCLSNDACSQIVNGSGKPEFAVIAEAINKTLRMNSNGT